MIASASLVIACGDDDPPVLDSDAGVRSDSGPPGSMCAPATGAVTLAGQWAIRADLDVELTERPDAFIQLCPDPQTTTASFIIKTTLTGSGTSLTQTLQFCDVGLPVNSSGVAGCPMNPTDNIGVSVAISDRLRNYLPTVDLTSTIALSGSIGGASFTPSPFVLLAGASLASPMTDPLPLWDTSIMGCQTFDPMPTPMMCVPSLSAMRDHDTDMHFGVTLDVVSNDPAMVLHGEAYTALRVAPTLRGMVRNANCVEGTLDSQLEFSVVDADIILSGVAALTPAIINNTPIIEVLPTSTFRMVRTDGTGANDFDDDSDGTVTCTEISRHSTAFD